MDRALQLALPAAILAVVVVLTRSLVAFESIRHLVELTTLTLLSRALWTTIAVVGFAATGIAYGRTARDAPPGAVLAVAGVAAFLGLIAGALVLRLATDVVYPGGLLAETAALGYFAAVEGVTLGFVALGGYALGSPTNE